MSDTMYPPYTCKYISNICINNVVARRQLHQSAQVLYLYWQRRQPSYAACRGGLLLLSVLQRIELSRMRPRSHRRPQSSVAGQAPRVGRCARRIAGLTGRAGWGLILLASAAVRANTAANGGDTRRSGGRAFHRVCLNQEHILRDVWQPGREPP